MALEKKLPTITQSQINAKGVSALADRPNATGQYGQSGMSPAKLKAWFDNLANLLAKNISEISDIFSGDDAAKYIRICLDNYNIDNLDKLVESFNNGTFAGDVLTLMNPFSANNDLVTVKAAFELVAMRFIETAEAILNMRNDAVETSSADATTKAQDAQTNANNYTDEKVNQAVTGINENLISPLRDSVGQNAIAISQANAKIAEVETVAKGANQAKSFSSYSFLFGEFNKKQIGAQELNVGQNLYIEDTGVPDLWVSHAYPKTENDTTYKYYTYISDDQVKKDLEDNGSIHVGYYKVSQLETQKVDLTNYPTKDELEEALSESGFILEEYI